MTTTIKLPMSHCCTLTDSIPVNSRPLVSVKRPETDFVEKDILRGLRLTRGSSSKCSDDLLINLDPPVTHFRFRTVLHTHIAAFAYGNRRVFLIQIAPS